MDNINVAPIRENNQSQPYIYVHRDSTLIVEVIIASSEKVSSKGFLPTNAGSCGANHFTDYTRFMSYALAAG